MNAVKNRLHQLIDNSSDPDLLDLLTDILVQNEQEGAIWHSLSSNQKERILLTNSETANSQKQVSHEEMKRKNQQWLR